MLYQVLLLAEEVSRVGIVFVFWHFVRALPTANLTNLATTTRPRRFQLSNEPKLPIQRALVPQEPQLRISSEFAGQHPDLQTDEDMRQRQSYNAPYDND